MTDIYSMTGYGRAQGRVSIGDLYIEVRSVNHKSFDLNFRGSREFTALEPKIRELVRELLQRGRVDVYLNLTHRQGVDQAVTVDKALAKRYKTLADKLKRELGLSGELSVDALLTLPDVLYKDEIPLDENRSWEETRAIVGRALSAVLKMQVKEGRKLAKDIRNLLRNVGKELKLVVKAVEGEGEKWRQTLRNRIEELTGKANLDPGRLEQEVAIIVARGDIQEEITRLDSHLAQFSGLLSEEGAVGRELDFMCQEMHREVNTMGSKSTSLDVTNSVIKMKGDVEKIREQIQNLK